MDLSALKKRDFWSDAFVIVVGTMLTAASIYYFLIPSKLVLGALSGVAIVIAELFGATGITIRVSLLLLIMNIFLLVLAYYTLGAEVGAKTVIVAIGTSPAMDLMQWIMPYTKLLEPGQTSVMGDPIMDLVAFVLLVSVSQAILFRINASTGGLDIVALIMQKYLHMQLGTALTIAGAAVCCMGILINPFKMVIIGIIGTWMNGIVIDYFMASLSRRKRVCVLTGDYEKVRKYIIENLDRGCTLYKVMGGYTQAESYEVQTLLTQTEFAKLLDFMRANDIRAFTTAGNCSEVYGQWRRRKQHV